MFIAFWTAPSICWRLTCSAENTKANRQLTEESIRSRHRRRLTTAGAARGAAAAAGGATLVGVIRRARRKTETWLRRDVECYALVGGIVHLLVVSSDAWLATCVHWRLTGTGTQCRMA